MSGAGRGKTITVTLACLAICGMLGLTAASVPLYRLFCAVTGYGGTTQVGHDLPDAPLARTIKIRFNADVDPDLPWSFRPLQREIEVRIGEQSLAFFQARNRSGHAITGQAVYNVTPFQAGPYFDKIACFCFDQQRLAAGQQVDMPVSFFVDPAILDDPDAKHYTTITLSYTFFRSADARDEQPSS